MSPPPTPGAPGKARLPKHGRVERLTLRLPQGLYAGLVQYAEAEEITLSEAIRRLSKRGLTLAQREANRA